MCVRAFLGGWGSQAVRTRSQTYPYGDQIKFLLHQSARRCRLLSWGWAGASELCSVDVTCRHPTAIRVEAWIRPTWRQLMEAVSKNRVPLPTFQRWYTQCRGCCASARPSWESPWSRWWNKWPLVLDLRSPHSCALPRRLCKTGPLRWWLLVAD